MKTKLFLAANLLGVIRMSTCKELHFPSSCIEGEESIKCLDKEII